MTGPTRPPSGSAPRQPWSPEGAPKGVTCPACGLANEDGARVCRNCGLPIARADDPVRGVAPGRIEMPSAKRSGASATIGLALVVGLLLVASTLAVSGGGILSSGGRLGGADAAESAAPGAETGPDGGRDSVVPVTEEPAGEDLGDDTPLGTSFDYTCDDDAIKDLSSRRWTVTRLVVGSRPQGGYDQVVWEMRPVGKRKAKGGTTVSMAWMDPSEARASYGAPDRVQGSGAIVVSFEGPVDIEVDRSFDSLLMEPQGVSQVRNIQMFDGTDGNVHTILGLRGQSCARMEGKGWAKKSRSNLARVLLQIERPG